jgi:hypothetical protein
MGIAVLHAMLMLAHLSVLDVALTFNDSSLLTLLILVQFAELKGSVMKTFDRSKLLETYRADIVERFHMGLFAVLLFLTNLQHRDYLHRETIDMINLVLSLSLIYVSEVLVDNIKHGSITAINHVPEQVFLEFDKDFVKELADVKSCSVCFIPLLLSPIDSFSHDSIPTVA